MNWRYIRRAARLVATALVALLLTLPPGLGFVMIAGLTRGLCSGSADPAAAGLPAQPVAFYAGDLQRDVRGYFVQGDNGATVIVAPTGSDGAGVPLAEIALLQRNGYSVLSYESRPCIGVPHSLGYKETAEVGDALAYLNSRSDVDPQRIAVYGFSTGGATAIMAGARFPQLAAVIALGGYADLERYLDEQIATMWYGPLFRLGAHAAYRLITGQPMSVLSPLRAIGQIAPRPVLLIYGSEEPSLPGARQQLAAAGETAQLWEVPGAAHGNYIHVAPAEFETRLIAFLDAALGVQR
ncbi:MAG: alpha/beta hydrolase [Aggregatilineales bacterium]